MPFQELMGLSIRLLTSAQTLAAIAARLRLDELGVDGDPDVRAHLDRVLDALGVRDDLVSLPADQRSVLLAFTRSYLAQALDFVEDPGRGGAWGYDDPVLLQAQGSASALLARLIEEAGLGRAGIRILDVGTGVAGLAIAFARTFPESTVVGVDPWEPALALARENVAAAGLDGRVTLVQSTVEGFDDDGGGFDLVWLPSFFIPERVLGAVLERLHALTRPGATVVVGLGAAGEDAVATAVDALFTVRSGGSALARDTAIVRLEQAGFDAARALDRTWDAPLELVVAHRS
jgi:SAM-dependent methyltransferase